MIINHRYKFIFFKTHRVGGTSVEAALSEICGPGDIWTGIGDFAEGHHRAPMGSGYKIPPELRESNWWLRRLGWIRPYPFKIMLRRGGYSGVDYLPHIFARHVRATLPREIWDSYYKVSIERNPWDKVVSAYYYKNERRRPSFEAYVRRTKRSLNFQIYSIDGEIIVDKLMKYESLDGDFAAFLERVGAPTDISIPKTNASKRGDKRQYRSMYNDELRDIVAAVHRREIAYCGYTF